MPAMLWMGSRMTPATSEKSAASRAARSPKGSRRQGVRLSAKGWVILGSSVTDRARIVRPCQPPSKAASFLRPVSSRATFRAFSLASAPLLQKKTESMPEKAVIRPAAASRTGRAAAAE